MKKFIVILFAGSLLVTLNTDARYRRACYAETCCGERVEEEPCGQPPCCIMYIRKTVPARRVKYISYGWECPENCMQEAAVASCDTSCGRRCY